MFTNNGLNVFPCKLKILEYHQHIIRQLFGSFVSITLDYSASVKYCQRSGIYHQSVVRRQAILILSGREVCSNLIAPTTCSWNRAFDGVKNERETQAVLPSFYSPTRREAWPFQKLTKISFPSHSVLWRKRSLVTPPLRDDTSLKCRMNVSIS